MILIRKETTEVKITGKVEIETLKDMCCYVLHCLDDDQTNYAFTPSASIKSVRDIAKYILDRKE